MEVEISDINRAKINPDINVVCLDKTTRNYKIDQPRAIEKKLKATERQTVELIETEGGLRIVLNTGSYELLKNATEKYFSELDDGRKCKIVQVNDQRGAIVESQFKLSSGKTSLYTMNLYNTTSSCLVNGKKTHIFRDKDFPQIIENIEQTLILNNTTSSEINENIRQMIIDSVSNENASNPTKNEKLQI